MLINHLGMGDYRSVSTGSQHPLYIFTVSRWLPILRHALSAFDELHRSWG